MLHKCLSCGKLFEGTADHTLCPECAELSKKSVMRVRTCRQCGTEFWGGPRAWYCPTCRAERARASLARRRATGPRRKIGSTDYCEICGKPYIVESGLQRYCKDCAEGAVRAVDREQSKKWYYDNVDPKAKQERRRSSVAEIPCVICGKLFRPSSGNAKTCSPECSAELGKQNHARYAAEHKAEHAERARTNRQKKIAAMSPAELAEYREAKNAADRKNYRKRKEKEMRKKSEIVRTLWEEALQDNMGRDAFASDWATSSIWGDDLDAIADMDEDALAADEQMLLKRGDLVGKIWDGAHASIQDLVHSTGMSQAAFAQHFLIPRRTLESWCMGERKPPEHVRYMLWQLLHADGYLD